MKGIQNNPTIHWAGIDVAKASFVAARWGHQELTEMGVRPFLRSRP